MAKFATALCILLVACGAQGSILSTITALIEKKENVYREEIEAEMEKIAESWATTQNMTKTFTQNLNATVEAIIEKYNEEIEELSSQYDNASACLDYSANLTEAAQNVASNITACATKSLTKLEVKYEAVYASVEELQSLMNNITDEAKSCASEGFFSSIVCYYKIYESMKDEADEILTTLLANVKTALASSANMETTLESCGFDSASTVLLTDAATFYAKYKECVESSSSST